MFSHGQTGQKMNHRKLKFCSIISLTGEQEEKGEGKEEGKEEGGVWHVR